MNKAHASHGSLAVSTVQNLQPRDYNPDLSCNTVSRMEFSPFTHSSPLTGALWGMGDLPSYFLGHLRLMNYVRGMNPRQ